MSGFSVTLLSAAASTGASASVAPQAPKRAIQVVISGTATCKVQGSMDDTNWVDLATHTSSGLTNLDNPVKYIRANVTAFTTGTVTAIAGW